MQSPSADPTAGPPLHLHRAPPRSFFWFQRRLPSSALRAAPPPTRLLPSPRTCSCTTLPPPTPAPALNESRPWSAWERARVSFPLQPASAATETHSGPPRPPFLPSPRSLLGAPLPPSPASLLRPTAPGPSPSLQKQRFPKTHVGPCPPVPSSSFGPSVPRSLGPSTAWHIPLDASRSPDTRSVPWVSLAAPTPPGLLPPLGPPPQPRQVLPRLGRVCLTAPSRSCSCPWATQPWSSASAPPLCGQLPVLT